MSGRTSLKVTTQTLRTKNGSYFKFSFKSILEEDEEEEDLLSQESTGSFHRFRQEERRLMIDPDHCSRICAISSALINLKDIDSDDEDPLILFNLKDIGLKSNFMQNVNESTFLKSFFMLQNIRMKKRLPNL
mmetsp:Transcript_13904/g.21672  ORF Transcript_13904/g.21672 Transcript_13904/m.21672 type:complete len:132 (+) Transcript_13904:976-1371(+)